MPEMHLIQPRFTYCVCGPFTKSGQRIHKFKETGDSQYIYQKELDEDFCQHDIANGHFEEFKIWISKGSCFSGL